MSTLLGRAATPQSRASKGQVVLIFALARKARIDQADVLRRCSERFGCRPSELSQWAAKEMIDSLAGRKVEA